MVHATGPYGDNRDAKHELQYLLDAAQVEPGKDGAKDQVDSGPLRSSSDSR